MKKPLFFASVALAAMLSVLGNAAPLNGSIAMGAFGATLNGSNLGNSTTMTPIALVTPGVYVGLPTGDFSAIPIITSGFGGVVDTNNLSSFVIAFLDYGYFGASAGLVLSQSDNFFDVIFEGDFVPDPAGPLGTFDVTPATVRVSMNTAGAALASYGATLESSGNPPEEIPEPATFALLGAGLAGLAMIRRKSL